MKVSGLRQTLSVAVAGFCGSVWFIDVIGHPAVVRGSSMAPTLLGGDSDPEERGTRDVVWLSKLRMKPEVGDIYTFICPTEPNVRHIKRVVGTGENRIRTRECGAVMIDTGHVWMESDNPINSLDSNRYGPMADLVLSFCGLGMCRGNRVFQVSEGLLRGRATVILWPPNRWKWL